MRCCRRCPQLPSLRRLWPLAALQSLPAREELLFFQPFHPQRVLSADARPRQGRWYAGGGRRATGKIPSIPPALFCCERFVRKRQRMKKAPFSGSFLRSVAEKVRRGRRISSAGKGGESAGQRKEKPCSSALSPCRCLETSLALRLTHLRLGSDSSPHDGGRDLPERPEETFSGKEGGRKAPLFQKGLLPPRYNRPGDDSRPGKTSRPVPDRWRSARPFR